jgi:hypothetical protein
VQANRKPTRGSASGVDNKDVKFTISGIVWSVSLRGTVSGTVESRGSKSVFLRAVLLSLF